MWSVYDNRRQSCKRLQVSYITDFEFIYSTNYSFSLFLSLSHKHTHTFGLLRFYEALTIFSAILYFEIVLSNLSCYSFSWMSIWWNIWRRPTTILPIIVCWTLNMLINQNDKIFKWCDFGFVKIFEQQT